MRIGNFIDIEDGDYIPPDSPIANMINALGEIYETVHNLDIDDNEVVRRIIKILEEYKFYVQH